MRLYDIIWKDEIVNKLAYKHQVMPEEVEQVLFSKPHTRYVEHGRVTGEDLYVAYGRTEAGRYLVRHLKENNLPDLAPFVVSLSNHERPFDKLRANGGELYSREMPYLFSPQGPTYRIADFSP